MAYRVAGRGRREELLTSNTRRKFSLAASFSVLGAGNLCCLGSETHTPYFFTVQPGMFLHVSRQFVSHDFLRRETLHGSFLNHTFRDETRLSTSPHPLRLHIQNYEGRYVSTV